jgi:hypothetical protein
MAAFIRPTRPLPRGFREYRFYRIRQFCTVLPDRPASLAALRSSRPLTRVLFPMVGDTRQPAPGPLTPPYRPLARVLFSSLKARRFLSCRPRIVRCHVRWPEMNLKLRINAKNWSTAQ